MNIHCMQTHSGKVVDLTRFSEEDVCVEDIAHALSQIIRFTGHARAPYTVAQHSLLVAELVPPQHRLWALLHDASEAYLGDVASPLKSLLPQYQELEEGFQRIIAGRFDLPWPMPREVKDADRAALMMEKRDLLLVHHDWPGQTEPDPNLRIAEVLPCWEAESALKEEILSLLGGPDGRG